MYMFPMPLIPRSRTLRGMARVHGVQSQTGVPKAWCDARGGSYQDGGFLPYGQSGACYYTETQPVAMEAPRAAQPTATRISVPTTTQVQVSPQISPVFVQQFQPSGSPVGAGTAMTGAPVAAPDYSKFFESEAARRAEESERQSALMERLFATREPQAAAPPQMQFIPGGPEAEPTPPSGAGGTAPASAGLFTAFGGGSMLPLLLAAGVIGFAVMGKDKKGARKAKRK